MNDMKIFELSIKLDEIMLHSFKREEFTDILIHCMQSMVILPRFELISLLDTLGEQMLEKNKSDDDLKRKISNVKKQVEAWIFSNENKRFYKIWKEEKIIPAKIQEIYKNTFGSDTYELMDMYIIDFVELQDKMEYKQKQYLRKWLLSSEKETEKISEDLEIIHLKELETAKLQDERREFDKKFVGGKTFKEREREQKEAEKIQPYIKENKKMENIKQMIDLKYIDSVQEIKKGDSDRFVKIFFEFEKKNGFISKPIKDIITGLWYGDYYKDDPSSNDILNIVKRYNLRFKISNDHINGEVNRLILQTYIIGLYLGSTVWDIYTVINGVLESNPTMTVHKIMPSMIHDQNVPNLKIQEVLNPVINNLPLDEEQSIIRENWNKIRFPNIDISNLVEYLQNTPMHFSLRYEIIRSIEELLENNHSGNVIKKGITIDGFARSIYQILKNKPMKIPITETEIKNLLDYEGNKNILDYE
jgi:hypothetical protein